MVDLPVDQFDLTNAIVVRVAMVGMPAFQLRKGEEGLSVFDPAEVDPPLTEPEILDSFRDGSYVVVRAVDDVESRGLRVELIEGAAGLTDRLREAHRELRPAPGMGRSEFKAALKGLE